MFNITWTDENGHIKDYECKTEAERDAKIAELNSKGFEASWEEVGVHENSN